MKTGSGSEKIDRIRNTGLYDHRYYYLYFWCMELFINFYNDKTIYKLLVDYLYTIFIQKHYENLNTLARWGFYVFFFKYLKYFIENTLPYSRNNRSVILIANLWHASIIRCHTFTILCHAIKIVLAKICSAKNIVFELDSVLFFFFPQQFAVWTEISSFVLRFI